MTRRGRDEIPMPQTPWGKVLKVASEMRAAGYGYSEINEAAVRSWAYRLVNARWQEEHESRGSEPTGGKS